MGDRSGAYRSLVGRCQGRRPLRTPTCRWKDNIKMIFKKSDGDMDWIALAQDRDRWRDLVNAVMNLAVP
jgi:hypothetical protein